MFEIGQTVRVRADVPCDPAYDWLHDEAHAGRTGTVHRLWALQRPDAALYCGGHDVSVQFADDRGLYSETASFRPDELDLIDPKDDFLAHARRRAQEDRP